ncbi:MAG: Spy/CpxP family protein refolding chaperone [Xanthobacteraceae bacterium]|jgi:hypothetical protein
MRKPLILVATIALVAGGMLTGPAIGRDRGDRVELSANQIVAQSDARTARMKADLRLTPDQEKNWSGFESSLREIDQKRAEREVTLRTERAQQNGSGDVIDEMRRNADSLSDYAANQKKLADAAQPLFASLDERQKQRFANELMNLGGGRTRN